MKAPSHKLDMEAVEALAEATPAQLASLVPELLPWLQDMNWPVAQPLARLLATCGSELVEPVREVLRSRDFVWKYWLLEFLCEVKPSVRLALAEDIVRLVNSKDEQEIAEEVPLVAKDVLLMINYCDP